MKPKLRIEIISGPGGDTADTGMFELDSRSLTRISDRLDKPNLNAPAQETLDHLRRLPAPWAVDFLRSL